ncbi:hypothetical protein TWF102_011590 [Orbilia oligospora]|uniref:F-box domain-containing protein n=1 Tax=Orbilia oligospora TaxID=2813651 RepID=A0A7C8JR89_ORBOL|nr:hypothetical protein TWF102_011590 [Orbilia oligospora]KAF3094626.1 hypothetical protein TWF706_008463 [Orbilia oligospora]KAF3096472.1 hypothetical protein TWF103_009806 [Orbilia oligospora]KAF3133189.1 hypothetical protein TWF703_007031 [Orbilia oligospora]
MSTTITHLPTELLFQILTQVLSSRSFKPREVARLASVCHRFYAVVVKYLYSNCDIQLHRRELNKGVGHVITLPRFSNETINDMLANAWMTLEAYKSHGKEVKFLSLKTTRGTFLTSTPPYQGPYKFTTSLPALITSLTPQFPTLTTLSLTDTLQTPLPIPTLISIISTILTTSPSLKHLSLTLTVLRSQETFTESQSHLQSLPSIIPSPTAQNLASLDSLSLDLHLTPVYPSNLPRWHRAPPNPIDPIWLLSSLPTIFPSKTLSTIKTLSFIVTGHTLPINPQQTVITGTSSKLILPSLQSLRLSVTEGCPRLFPQYISPTSYKSISHLEVLETYELNIETLLLPLLTSFPTLTSLTLKKIDTRRKSLNWRFLAHLKSTILEHLKTLTIYTSATVSKILHDLGTVFVANTVLKIFRERIPTAERTMDDGSPWRVVVEFAY